MSEAADYLVNMSEVMSRGYYLDCVAHASSIAGLLLKSGRPAWIARLRRITRTGDHVFHEPLTPTRFTGAQSVTWNTHYICCSEGEAYDPMVAKPIPIDQYCRTVFGFDGTLEAHLSPEVTATLWREGTLKESIAKR